MPAWRWKQAKPRAYKKFHINIASGARKDPAVEILDLASKRTRKVIDDAAEEYLEALKKQLVRMGNFSATADTGGQHFRRVDDLPDSRLASNF